MQVLGDPVPRWLMILVGLAAATITVSGLKSIGGMIAPVILGIVLIITVYPIRDWLIRRRVPRVIASLAVVLSVYVILAVLVLALVLSAARLATLIPDYAGQFNNLVADGTRFLKDRGVTQDQINQLLSKLDVGQLVSVASDLFSRALSVLSNLLLIALLVLFVGFDSGTFAGNLTAARAKRPYFVDAMTGFAAGTRRYFAVSAAFGLVCALLDGVTLALMSVPGAEVWAVLAFVTNFVPNIGFFIGLVPPAVLALLSGGPGLMIAVVVAYFVINFVVQSLIQPKFIGDAVGVTASIAFLSLIFWAFVLGPLGAVLALPMTQFVKALFIDVDPGGAWLLPLVSGEAPKAQQEK